MASLAPGGPLQPLDLRRAIGETLSTVQASFPLLVETALLPAALSFLLSALSNFVGLQTPFGLLLRGAALVPQIAFAVTWHRAVLLGPGEGGARHLRFGLRELRYLGYGIANAAIATLVLAPVGLILGLLLGEAALFGTLFLLLAFLAAAILVALSFIFPAVALELPRFGLREAWLAARGVLPALVGTCLLLLIPGEIAVNLLVLLVAELQAAFGASLLALLVGIAGTYLLLAVGVTAVSVCFRARTGWRP